MKLALKIDVDTLRGTEEGVPRLVELLKKHGAGATFLFSLGRDHTGRALRRMFRPGFFSKVSRTSVLEHYGLRTLLYGTLLPGPDIGRRCAAVMRAVRDSGSRLLVRGVGMADGDNHAEAAGRVDTGHCAEKLGSNRENASVTGGRLQKFLQDFRRRQLQQVRGMYSPPLFA